MEGADVRDKSIYINLDHQDVKSTTNLFGGYYDWKVDGGQRWLSASGVKAGKLADAPDGKNNLSFDGQTKYNHGMLFTLNHIQNSAINGAVLSTAVTATIPNINTILTAVR